MFVQIVNPVSGRRAKMEARTLGKVLHLACFHDWHPERLASQPSSASWDTEIMMPYVSPYLSGTVSDADAAALAACLKHVLASEGPGLPSDVYLGVLGLIAVASAGQFSLQPE
jgi:hypothetical protein